MTNEEFKKLRKSCPVMANVSRRDSEFIPCMLVQDPMHNGMIEILSNSREHLHGNSRIQSPVFRFAYAINNSDPNFKIIPFYNALTVEYSNGPDMD